MAGSVSAVDASSRAAQMLVDARRSGRRLAALPDDVRPQSAADAYRIQDAVLAQLGRSGGWKVGAKTPTAEPTCAPLPASRIFRSPQQFPAGAFALNGIEAELAVTLSRDLPPRERPYTETDIAAAIETVHPAIEIVDSQFVDMTTVDAWSLLADFQSNRALVLGAGVAAPRSLVSGGQAVRLFIDEAETDAAPGRNPAGSLLRLIAWLADHCAQRCKGLRCGDVVTTGSWTGLRFVRPGTRIAAVFPGIGEARVGF
jgi:2-keto-4-pentenoate hydratase